MNSADNQDHTLRFRRDAHGSTFPCFFEILFIFKGFLKSCDIFTTHMCLGVICTAPYAHGSTFKTTNMPTCTRSPHTISRRVHISKCSTYFASHISPWSRYHLLAGMNADHSTVARLHFFSKRFVLSARFFATVRDFHLFAISFFGLQHFFTGNASIATADSVYFVRCRETTRQLFKTELWRTSLNSAPSHSMPHGPRRTGAC